MDGWWKKRWMMPRHKFRILLCMFWACNRWTLRDLICLPCIHYTAKVCV
jgi:hypothetical protein